MRLPSLDLIEIGKALAHATDDEQGCVLNAMARELASIKKHDRETQLCYIGDKLNFHGRAMIQDLAEFVLLRNNAESGSNRDGGKRNED